MPRSWPWWLQKGPTIYIIINNPKKAVPFLEAVKFLGTFDVQTDILSQYVLGSFRTTLFKKHT